MGRVRVMPLVIATQAAVIAVLVWQRVTMPAVPASARVGQDALASRSEPADLRPALVPVADSRAIAEAEAAYRLAALVRTPRAESGTTSSSSDPVGIVVYGRVVDESGVDIRGASIDFEDENGTTCAANAADDWQVAYGLHPGTWTVRATAWAFKPFKADIVLSAVSSRFRYDVVLSRSTIAFVRFETPKGERLRHDLYEQLDLFAYDTPTAVVTAEPADSISTADLRCLARLGWDDEGIRKKGIDPPEDLDGFVDVPQAPPFWVHAVSCDTILASHEVRTPLELVVFKIDVAAIASKLAAVTVRVVDAASRAPIENASVALGPWDLGSGGEASPADGRMTFRNRLPGLLRLVIESEGRERYERFLRLEPGSNVDLGDVELGSVVPIRGRLLGVDGRPIVGTVSCVRLDCMTFPQPFTNDRMTFSTRSDGSFEISWYGRGRYLVRGEDGRNASAPAIVDTTAGEADAVDVRMVRGAVLSLDLDLSGLNRLVELRNPAGDLVLSDFNRGTTQVGVTVPPGTYTLTIRDGAQVTHSRQITVGSSPLRVRVSG